MGGPLVQTKPTEIVLKRDHISPLGHGSRIRPNTEFTIMACVETCIPLENDFLAFAVIPPYGEVTGVHRGIHLRG